METYRVIVEHYPRDSMCQGWLINMKTGHIESMTNIDSVFYGKTKAFIRHCDYLPFKSAQKLLSQCDDLSHTFEFGYESFIGYIGL